MPTREFHFSEGTSNKFWRISVDGSEYTVEYGRMGTAGQTQTKQFSSDAEARKAADKLVAEKLKKGYVEVGVSAAAAAASQPASPRPASPPKPAPKAPAEEPPAAPAVDEPTERTIALAPDDWRWATWRRIPPRERPAPAPFDRDDALRRLSKLRVSQWWEWNWGKLGIPSTPSREEALFWFDAIATAGRGLPNMRKQDLTPKLLAEALAEVEPPEAIDLTTAREAFESRTTAPPELVAVVAALLSPLDAVEVALRGEQERRLAAPGAHYNSVYGAFAEGFRVHVRPFLSESEAAAIRDRLRPEVSLAAWSTVGTYDVAPVGFRVAGLLGMSDELREVVESWQDGAYGVGTYGQYYHKPQEIVFGLDDPKLVEAHIRRLHCHLTKPEHVRGWLAHTEYGALDWVRSSIIAAGNKEEAAKLLDELLLVSAPEAAPHMLVLSLTSKAPRAAREWLDAHPRFAVEGLVGAAAGRGKIADAAVEHLRAMLRKGYEELIRSALEPLAPEAAARVRGAVLERDEPSYTPFDDATTPEWLVQALADPVLRKAKAPAWVSPEELPPVTFGANALNTEQAGALLRALAASKHGWAPALVREVKSHADPASADAFAWRLCERWLSDGAPSKDGWALKAVGLLGGDPSVLKLAPMIRAWPGESQHQRAVNALDVLRTIGTDTALMQINGIAQKVKFKGLKKRAAECMEEIATERGLTRAELEDRIVPDCGLDERGSRVFDFGPRRFEFLLGPDMKPMVREPGGKPRSDMPKPGAKDDAALAAEAVAEWKLLKKQVAEVAKIQAARLEKAMVTGRRWSTKEFEQLLVGHPLMRHIVRLLVWGAYDDAGALRASFRVTEDDTYADERDETFDLGSFGSVAVVHPLALTPEQRSAWGEVLGDYEIVPPFAQLGRPIHTLEDAERTEKEIARFKAFAIPATALVFTLEKLGWERGLPQDGGVFFEHSKAFYGANVTAIVEYPGVPVGYIEGWDDQHVEHCYFVKGIRTSHMYTTHKEGIPLGQVDDVVISEVLADLTLVASKGK